MTSILLAIAALVPCQTASDNQPSVAKGFYVVDFSPTATLRSTPQIYRLTFTADREEPAKPFKWQVRFSPDGSATTVRDAAYNSLQQSSCKVKTIGETKIHFYGCKTLELKTEAPGRVEMSKETRPTMKKYDTEEEALKVK
jgi:hypothetical protein